MLPGTSSQRVPQQRLITFIFLAVAQTATAAKKALSYDGTDM